MSRRFLRVYAVDLCVSVRTPEYSRVKHPGQINIRNELALSGHEERVSKTLDTSPDVSALHVLSDFFLWDLKALRRPHCPSDGWSTNQQAEAHRQTRRARLPTYTKGRLVPKHLGEPLKFENR